MSISERQAPDFSHALRGYDRAQVDEYLASYTEYSVQVEERARKAETALAQCRRELASSPGTVGISERSAAILQLANEGRGPRAPDRERAHRAATAPTPSTTPSLTLSTWRSTALRRREGRSAAHRARGQIVEVTER
jgi:cell division septum initiation protein DivIVA